MKIVCISGKARSGKDTTASAIERVLTGNGSRVLITHYADLVKYVCKMFFGWNGEKDTYGRTLLQHIGTDIIRQQDPDYWVDFLLDMFRFFPDQWDYVLIPDARFPNEITVLREAGYDVMHIHVVRDAYLSPLTVEQITHPSETSMEAFIDDTTRRIWNCGTLKELEAQAEKLALELLQYTQMTFEDVK